MELAEHHWADCSNALVDSFLVWKERRSGQDQSKVMFDLYWRKSINLWNWQLNRHIGMFSCPHKLQDTVARLILYGASTNDR